MKLLLNSPSSHIKDGFKDKVMLTVLYDTGARVDELIHMKLMDIHLDKPSSIKIKGKGNKVRVVPIMGNTVKLLKKYIDENNLKKGNLKIIHIYFKIEVENHIQGQEFHILSISM